MRRLLGCVELRKGLRMETRACQTSVVNIYPHRRTYLKYGTSFPSVLFIQLALEMRIVIELTWTIRDEHWELPLGLRSIDIGSHQKRVVWCALGGRAQWNICIDLDNVRAGAIDRMQILDGKRHPAGTCREPTRLVK